MKRIRFYNILIALSLANTLIGFGQTNDKTKTLTGDYTNLGIDLVEARDWVKLDNTFLFTASNDKTITIRTDEKIIAPANYTATFESGGDRSDLTGGHVGSLPGRYLVSPNGAATYSVPIDMPPGVNGLKPSVSINYNSRGGNGLLGWGWDLAASSAIIRGTTSLQQEGSINEVDFTGSDMFFLDGQRLILVSGTHNSSGAEYKAEVDNLGRVKMLADTDGKLYFEAHSGTGRVLKYKEKHLTSTGEVMYWALSEITDYDGNTVTYGYNYFNGELLLDHIEYSSVKVDFFYMERVFDPNITYTHGEEIGQSSLLRKIKVSINDELYREYGLSYGKKLYYHLNEIAYRSGDGAETNPTIIEWEDDLWEPSSGVMAHDPKYLKYFGDFNGDGLTDILSLDRKEDYTSSDDMVIAINNGDGTSYTSSTISLSADFEDVCVGDFDNDGKDDIYVHTIHKYWTGFHETREWHREIKYAFYQYQSGSGIVANTSHDLVYVEDEGDPFCNVEPFMVNADFNGDGVLDYIIFDVQDAGYGEKTYTLYKANFSPQGGGLSSFPSQPDAYSMRIVNFNGNRLPDIFIDRWGTSKIFEFDKDSNSFVEIGSTGNSFSYSQAGDFNGDGLTDFCPVTLSSDDNFYIYYGTGKGYVHKDGPFTLDEPYYIEDPKEVMYVTDLNADGKSDIVRYHFTVTRVFDSGSSEYCFTPELHARAYLSTGAGFTERNIEDGVLGYDGFTICYMGHPAQPKENMEEGDVQHLVDEFVALPPLNYNIYPTTSYYDFNGDGNGDVLLRNNYDDHKIVSVFEGGNDNLVRKVYSGMNLLTEFNYATLYDPEAYSRTSSTDASVFHILGPLYVVKQVRSIDGGTVFENFNYEYKNAKIHREFGFLGFEEFKMTDNLTDIYSDIQYEHIGDRYFPKVSVTRVGATGGSLMSTATFTNQSVQKNGSGGLKYYQLRTTGKTETDNLTSRAKATTFANFNNYNQPGTITDSYGGDMTITKTITYSAVNTSAHWLPGRISMVVVTQKHKDDASNFSSTTGYSYYSSYPHRLLTKTLRKNTDKQLTETYQYEPFGSVNRIEISDGSETRYTDLAYTADNRFVREKKANNKFPVTYEYDQAGNVTSEKDHNGQEVKYTYGGFGVLKETEYPDGRHSYHSISWQGDDAYYTQVATDGQGTSRKYYNYRGQLKKEEAPGELNKTFKVDYEYYADGRLYKEYDPYSTSKSSFTEYQYDIYGRIENTITAQGTIHYQYTGNKVKVTDPSGWTEKTYDNFGLVTTAEDYGGTISYTYYSNGLPHTTTYDGNVSSMAYDAAGNRTQLTEPNAGTINSSYNAFGEQLSNTNARGKSIATGYDVFGRVDEVTMGSETINYTYDNTTGLLTSIAGPGASIAYEYDALMRVWKETETINSQNFITKYTYDPGNGAVKTIEYPGGFAIENIYDNNGFNTEIKKATGASIWKLDATNNKGLLTGHTLGNGISTTFGYDAKDRPTSINAGSVFNWQYSFTDQGNLDYRKNVNSTAREDFDYDALNRLTTYNQGTVSYDDNGNITNKTDIGAYEYSASRPNAVSKIIDPEPGFEPVLENIEYTWFDKVRAIKDNATGDSLVFGYGVDFQRRVMRTYGGGAHTTTKYYVGAYEEIAPAGGGPAREITYVSSPYGLAAINIKETDGTETLYYAHTDYLGSIMALSNQGGTKVEEYFYDAWGKRKNPGNWGADDNRTSLLIDRGYTGHEHLGHFGFINMNGRVYDPEVGAYLSPDPYVQMPGFTQNFNRYAYCLNNPLIYTDPSGEIIFTIIGALLAPVTGGTSLAIGIAMDVGGGINLITHAGQIDNFGEAMAYYGVGALDGGVKAAAPGLGFLSSGVSAGLNSMLDQGWVTDGFNAIDMGEVGKQTILGGVSGAVSYGTGELLGKYGVSNKLVEGMGVSNAVAKNIMIRTIDEGIKGGVSGFASGVTEKLAWGTGDIWQTTWQNAAIGAANGFISASAEEIITYYRLRNSYKNVTAVTDEVTKEVITSRNDLDPISNTSYSEYPGYLGTIDGEITSIYNVNSRTQRVALTRTVQVPGGTRIKVSYYSVPTAGNFNSIVRLLRLR